MQQQGDKPMQGFTQATQSTGGCSIPVTLRPPAQLPPLPAGDHPRSRWYSRAAHPLPTRRAVAHPQQPVPLHCCCCCAGVLRH